MSGEGTEIRPFDEAALADAVALIRAGQPVAVPTETVYGLAADATEGEAVARIYAAKGRPSFNPLIVHVSDLAAAERIGIFDATSRGLAKANWPGPLTLVVTLREDAGIASLVTAGLRTIALRVPAHPVMQALLRGAERPLAAPSANASGRISPTTAEHVRATLEGRIPLILDGGPTERGIESTIVAVSDDGLRLLRPGPVTIAGAEIISGGAIEAPGMMASHYAPQKPVRLEATERVKDEWLIGFGPVTGNDTLSARGNLEEAAARLFACLHRADAQDVARIAVAPVPDEGLGRAINDRLKRAAA